jgi:hypothetical protein
MIEALSDPSSLMECIPIYTCISKDEVRDQSKLCRDLAFPPVWFSDLATMYEKGFFVETIDKWWDSPIKLGIPLPQGWPYLVDSLTRHRNTIPGFESLFAEWDASQFDRTHPIELTLSWHEFMELKGCFATLGSEHFSILDYINFWSCFRLVYLPNGRIVLVLAGIYSGDISTSNKNSYFHVIRLALCWCRIFGSIQGFRMFVRTSGLSCFGDDGVCAAHYPMAVRFLTELSGAWEAQFGSSLKMKMSKDISGVSFLGKRSLGNDSWSQYIPVTSDLDRQIASLVLKGKRSHTPAQSLSKLVAHRFLLSGFAFDAAEVDEAERLRNERGRRDLNTLDEYIRVFIKPLDALNKHDPEWVQLVDLGTMPARELFSNQLLGKDVLVAE